MKKIGIIYTKTSLDGDVFPRRKKKLFLSLLLLVLDKNRTLTFTPTLRKLILTFNHVSVLEKTDESRTVKERSSKNINLLLSDLTQFLLQRSSLYILFNEVKRLNGWLIYVRSVGFFFRVGPPLKRRVVF